MINEKLSNAQCKKIGSFPFVVEPFSEDCAGFLSWRFMGNHLLRCASLHAGANGFGYEQMIREKRAWVLSRLIVDLEEMPRTGQRYFINTWVNRIYRQFTDRMFTVTDGQGKVFGNAFSIWALIDINSRRPVDLETLPGGDFSSAVVDEKVEVNLHPRVRMKMTEPVRELTARYSDLDINGHVNSIRYIEMLLDLFEPSFIKEHPMRHIEMAYCSESRSGDTLKLFRESLADGTFSAEIKKNEEEAVVKSLLEFR